MWDDTVNDENDCYDDSDPYGLAFTQPKPYKVTTADFVQPGKQKIQNGFCCRYCIHPISFPGTMQDGVSLVLSIFDCPVARQETGRNIAQRCRD